MPRVVHFEVPADDPDRAAAFYAEVFGWTITRWRGREDYWEVSTGTGAEGIDGGLRRRAAPVQSTVATVDVASVDKATAKVVEQGGRIVMPTVSVPGVGYLAYCEDTEGNVFGVIESGRPTTDGPGDQDER